MRPQSDLPRRSPRRLRAPGRGRTILIAAAVVLFILITSLRSIAGFYTDYLWFNSLHLTEVWRTVLGAKAALTVIFIAAFFALAWVNLTIADRVAPQFPPTGPQEELVERYRQLIAGHAKLVRAGVSFLFALIAGAGVSARWNDWVLFTHRVDFHQTDATFHTDIGFYVFQLPFLTFVAGWLFTAVLITLVITVAAHYLNGGIRSQGALQRVTPQVKAHLSVLLGFLALVKAAQYWLARYQLVFSTRGTVDGATYTDVHVQKSVIYLLIIISMFAFGLFVVNIWRRGWVLPVLAVGLWVFVAILAGGIVPAFVQQVRVKPAESTKEAPYIQHNIDATRAALKLNGMKTKTFAADGKLDAAALNDNAATVRNVRLWDPAENILRRNFQITQGLRSFYGINDVDVDRYPLQSAATQVMFSARDLNTQGVNQKSWEAQHLLYTHGYGVVAAPANAKGVDGSPKLVVRDIPVVTAQGAPKITQPRIYIGEGQNSYVMVNTRKTEIDGLGNENTKPAPYHGHDGVTVGNGLTGFLRRAAFSLRFGDANPLISGNVKADSKVILQRSVRERLKTLAPFLSFDHDPYLVITNDGRLKWVVDAYTTTNRYPNAQRVVTEGLNQGSDLAGKDFNYVRNSVKAVVDAYDGTVKLYVIDDKDPLIQAYRKAFPELFTSGREVPADLRSHFRYPEDMFTVQTTMWGRYHINKPQDFYTKQDAWAVATEPGSGGTGSDAAAASPGTTAATATTAANGAVTSSDDGSNPIPAYYQLMRLPREDKESFLILRPFVPSTGSRSARPLRSFMVAKSDAEDYGQLETFVVPGDRETTGPEAAAQNMQSNTDVSRNQSLLGTAGSKFTYGNLLVVPVDQTVLYVRPVYIQGSGDQAAPLLKFVIIGYQNAKGDFQVTVNETFGGALAQQFGAAPNTQEDTTAPPITVPGGTIPGGTTPGGTIPGGTIPGGGQATTESQLIAQLNSAVTAGQAALAKQDLGEYKRQFDIVANLAMQLQALKGAAPTGSGPTSTVAPTTAPTAAPAGASPTTAPTTAPLSPSTTAVAATTAGGV